ncbi:hypothetical protein L4C37_15240 [Vibrio kagoshimensis]|uniref:hypothetical protein n=1 Tax=Vibrio kagoshimensis TaxID=2910244 RepID=UPI003D23C2C6
MTTDNKIERDSKGINKELYKRVEEQIKPMKEERKKAGDAYRKQLKYRNRYFKITGWYSFIMQILAWFCAEGVMQTIVGSNETVYYSLFLICVIIVSWHDNAMRGSNPLNIFAAWPARWANVPCHMLICPSFINAYLFGVYLYANLGMNVEFVLGAALASFVVFLYLLAPIFKICEKYAGHEFKSDFDDTFVNIAIIPFQVFLAKMFVVDVLTGYSYFPYIDVLYWLPYGEPASILDGYYEMIGN